MVTFKFNPVVSNEFNFSFGISESIKVVLKASLLVTLDTKILLRKECDDPPCHEMIYIQEDWRGKYLNFASTELVQEPDGYTHTLTYQERLPIT